MLKRSALVERTVGHVLDRFVSAGEKNVENGQGAFQFLGVETYFHVLGDEKAKSKRGIHRFLKIVQGGAKMISDPERVWRGPQRFFAAKNVDVGFGKKLVDVEKIGAAEHVKRHRNMFFRFREILFLPVVQLQEPAPVHFGKNLFEIRGVLLPRRIAR